MGNICGCKRKSKRKVVLLLVGLDNAGKTVAVKGLAGENPNDSIPTVGFSVVNLNYSGYFVQIYDLGGGSDIRGIWHRYFVDAHGVIFVVDASDYDRFEEVKQVLRNLLSHEKISGKPVLLLANKQDNQEALDEIDIVEKLELENLVNEKKCPTLVEPCSAKELNSVNQIDPGIRSGYRWLLNYILRDYENINQRVEEDVQRQKEIDSKLRKEKFERLKLTKSTQESEENDNDFVKISSPFRPINEVINNLCDEQNNKSREISDNDNYNEYNKKTARRNSDISKQNDIKRDIKHFPVENGTSSPNLSVKSTNSYIFERIEQHTESDRPKSAVQIVKQQLEKSNRRGSFLNFSSNKTAPVTLLSPKSAPLTNKFEETDNLNFRSASSTGQILTVTELPNAIIDSNGENIGDLFELSHFSNGKKLPPIRQKSFDMTWVHKPLRNSVNVVQSNIDEIYKDIS